MPHTGPVNLIAEFYLDDLPARQDELDECLHRNLAHEGLAAVCMVADGRALEYLPDHPKLIKHRQESRPTFARMFEIAGTYFPDTICVVANTDIYFDETLTLAPDPGDTVLALTRWNVKPDGQLDLFLMPGSQDAWIFRTPLALPSAVFTTGRPGCDNKLAYLLHEAGRHPWNPSRTVHACHLHLTDKRNYTARHFVPGPYALLPQVALRA